MCLLPSLREPDKTSDCNLWEIKTGGGLKALGEKTGGGGGPHQRNSNKRRRRKEGLVVSLHSTVGWGEKNEHLLGGQFGLFWTIGKGEWGISQERVELEVTWGAWK